MLETAKQSFFYDKVSYEKVLQKFLRGMMKAHGRRRAEKRVCIQLVSKVVPTSPLYNRMKFASPSSSTLISSSPSARLQEFVLSHQEEVFIFQKRTGQQARRLLEAAVAVKTCIFIFLLLALLQKT